ncbi:MAG: peptidoglycan recognition protein family protein, partial [Candidatus Obscuribacterales bacterium]|nr:peptidoglycan recognition protein family protein [Candidatus Obscuribacterales bacterium]
MIKFFQTAFFSLLLSLLISQQAAFSTVRTLVPPAPGRFTSRNQASTHAKQRSRKHKISHSKTKTTGLSAAQRALIKEEFVNGDAGKIDPEQLANAGVFSRYALKGGIFKRRSDVRCIVIHSTETAREASAKTIVRSWNNAGPKHPGTQYIVDRDGTIYQTVNPSLATFHVDSSRTIAGVNNDSSVGIEIVRTGSQQYTNSQLASVPLLVHYLKNHFA